MTVAIQIVWWIGIAGALILTLVVLKEVTLVINALRDIDTLADYILEAGEGIAKNVAVESRMRDLIEPGQQLQEQSRRLAKVSGLVAQGFSGAAGGIFRGV